jgi:hypothetical protein
MNILQSIRKRFFLRNWWYWVPGLLMISLFLIFYSKIYNDLNADLIAYFSIAKHYQDFDFIEAFNSYWSPLICWLMAMAPNLKENPVGVFRTINIFVAFLIYYQLFFFIRLAVQKLLSRFLLCLLLALLMVQLSLSSGAPDFLSLFCFLIFLKQLILYRFHWKQSIFLSLSILLCFFSKAFLLALCLSIVGLYMLYTLFKIRGLSPDRLQWLVRGQATNKGQIGKSILLLLVVLVVGLFIWASCLKLHYGFYTLSSSGTFNNNLPTHEIVSLQTPISEKALFMWEDPYYIKRIPFYEGSLESISNNLLGRFKQNSKITLYYFQYLSYLWIFILILPILGFFQKRDLQWKIGMLLFVVFIINWFGYFLIFIMERYLIIGQVVLYLSAFGFLEILCRKIPKSLSKFKIQSFAMVILFVTIAKNPVDQIRYGIMVHDKPHNETTQARLLAESGILKGKKIATFYDNRELYDYLSLACFQGDGKYLGEIWSGKSEEEQIKEIHQHQLDYIVISDYSLLEEKYDNKNWLSSLPLVYTDQIMKVKVFWIKK